MPLFRRGNRFFLQAKLRRHHGQEVVELAPWGEMMRPLDPNKHREVEHDVVGEDPGEL